VLSGFGGGFVAKGAGFELGEDWLSLVFSFAYFEELVEYFGADQLPIVRIPQA